VREVGRGIAGGAGACQRNEAAGVVKLQPQGFIFATVQWRAPGAEYVQPFAALADFHSSPREGAAK